MADLMPLDGTHSPESTFNAADWCRRNEVTPIDGRYWQVWGIISPYDACCLLKIRELMEPYTDFGAPSPVDVFLLSLGEGPHRACTKIGGLPSLGRDRDWPKNSQGRPLPFLAQFDFQHSVDIVTSLPGEILLIFAEPHLEEEAILVWERARDALELVTADDVPVTSPVPLFHGNRWRTECYPEADMHDDDFWSGIALPDGTEVLDPFFATELIAMQIGSHPFEAQPFEILRPGEQFICSLPSIVPLCDRPFPFVNHAAPLDEASVERLSLHLGWYQDIDDFDVLYVLRKPDGTFRSQWRCL